MPSNAARIGNAWVLIDATWDAGNVTDSGFEKQYDTDYLFAPPEIQGVTHFPEEPRWQLREPALTRGDFFRQPVMRPRFFSEGFRLVSPDRSQITVAGTAEVALENRRGRYLLAHAQAGRDTCARLDSACRAGVMCTGRLRQSSSRRRSSSSP